jgi:hypothetical protein
MREVAWFYIHVRQPMISSCPLTSLTYYPWLRLVATLASDITYGAGRIPHPRRCCRFMEAAENRSLVIPSCASPAQVAYPRARNDNICR